MNGEKAAEAQDEQLPRFDGDPTAAEKWLNDFEKLSAASSTGENDKLESVASCFTGLALEWFVERDEAFQSWSELREEFLVRFLRPEAPQADAYVRLRRLIQDDKTDFCAHLIEVLRLCHIAHPYMTEKEQISWFMKSVRPDYRPALVLSGIDSLNTLRDKCALIDTVEPFRNEIALKSKIPFVRRATPSSSSKSNVTFATKEVQTVQTMRRSEPLPNHAGGDNRPPRRSFKPYCNHCARFGHTTRNCYALGRR